MIITIDTEKDNLMQAKEILESAAMAEHFRKQNDSNKHTLVEIHNSIEPLKFTENKVCGKDAFIGKYMFGHYGKGQDDKWLRVFTVLTVANPELFATPAACEKWLTDRYNELVNAIIKTKP